MPTVPGSRPWVAEFPWTYVRGRQPIKLSVSNKKEFDRYKLLDQGKARELESLSPLEREGKIKVYLFADDVSAGSVRAKIVRAELFDHAGNRIGEFGPDRLN